MNKMDMINQDALSIAKIMQDEITQISSPTIECPRKASEKVIPISLVNGTRGYIEKVVIQINGCYEMGWFDACAVMIRRLIETLLIETFEHNRLDHKIKYSNGDFLFLADIIDKTLIEPSWNLTRGTKKVLPLLKKLGDYSAHNRRYTAQKQDIDLISYDLRAAVQEFLYISSLK